jgi:hypothetical protein
MDVQGERSATLARLREVHPVLWLGLLLAAVIAAFAPLDRAFDFATLGNPALRAIAIVALAVVGLMVGRRAGLGIEPVGLKHPILTPIAVAAGMAVFCAAADWGLAGGVSHHYATTIDTIPVWTRIAGFGLRAYNENILYRLFLGSVLVWLIGRVWRRSDGAIAAGAYVTGFVLSQVINIWINVTSHGPLTGIALIHDAVRYITPGLVWSWLYWRHGFQSNEIACTSVHVFLQPILSLGLV